MTKDRVDTAGYSFVKLKFHLFPGVELVLPSDMGKVLGLRFGNGLCSGPDDEGNRWLDSPCLISIVSARRPHTCGKCGKYFGPRYNFMRRQVGHVHYLGLNDSCTVEPWGYDTTICLDCAREIFKDAKVYRCDWWDDTFGWEKILPKVDKPSLDLIRFIDMAIESDKVEDDGR